MLNVKYPQVNSWLNDKRTPSTRSIEDMCRVLNCTPNELLGYAEPQPIAPQGNAALIKALSDLEAENQALKKALEKAKLDIEFMDYMRKYPEIHQAAIEMVRDHEVPGHIEREHQAILGKPLEPPPTPELSKPAKKRKA